MKDLSIKNLLLTNFTIKIFSLFFGFSLWFLLAQTQLHELSYQIPICFFGNNEKTITGPEYIHVTLQGSRQALSALKSESLALHINTDLLLDGKNSITLCQKDLFLPSDINMLDCNPRVAEIIVNSLKDV